MEDTHVHALDYLSVFYRRRWWLAGPLIASTVIGALLLRVLPKEYKSSATLAVAAPAVSPNLVNQSAFDNQDRIRALSQQLLSTSILSRVVKEEGLGAGASDDPQIARMRRAIGVTVPDPVAPTSEPRRLDTFIVSYDDAEPARAQRITNRLVNVFVDENSRSRTASAEDTSQFIAAQQRASQMRLNELEAELRQAKEAHMGQLPEQMQANLQTLSGLRQQLEANATGLRGEEDRLSMIERQVDGANQGSADALLPPHGDTEELSPESRVLALRRELAQAQAVYTDKHPEVLRLREELQAAQKDASTERQKPASDRMAQLQLDPAYRQLAADREMSRLRIRDLQRADGDIKRQISVYQARVESAPMVEQQLAAVQREYDLEKQQYSDLSTKFHTATIAENVERNGRGEQFTVLYGASYPTEPVKPIPWRVMVIAIVIGACLGAGAAFAREYLDRSVHSIRDLKDEFGLPVLGEVAPIESA